MFNLYDSDEDEFYSETEDDGGLGADVADALAHYQQLEAERLADSAHQVHDHLEAVAQQGPPLAHVRAQSEVKQRSHSPTKPAAIPVAEDVERPQSQPTRRRMNSKGRAPKATYTETPGSSSSGVAPRGRSTEPKITRYFKLLSVPYIAKQWGKVEMKQFLKDRGVSVSPSASKTDMASHLKQFDNEAWKN